MKLAFVVPRYGAEIVGGAETLARNFAERLPRAEFDVEVWTTCADDLQTWRNVYPAGVTHVNGVRVRRFPIDAHMRNEKRYWELMIKFTNRWPTTVDDEYEWIAHSAHSPALYAHIAQQGQSYDYLIFLPYLFGTTFYGTTLWPERTFLFPCLHDEPFARFVEACALMESCRGLLFISPPEMGLARGKLGVRNPRARLVGMGIDDRRGDAERFLRTFNISDPFILYAGRFDSMKNLLELFEFFRKYKRQRGGRLKLVLRGVGPLPIPAHPDIVPIGFQPEEEKLDAYAAATVLCQPSRLESFSIVLMESWLAGVPVLAHGDCDVTRHHVLRSNGGLYYATLDEFSAALDWFLAHQTERAQMGQQGRAYVLREHNWDVVITRFRAALSEWRNA